MEEVVFKIVDFPSHNMVLDITDVHLLQKKEKVDYVPLKLIVKAIWRNGLVATNTVEMIKV